MTTALIPFGSASFVASEFFGLVCIDGVDSVVLPIHGKGQNQERGFMGS